MPEASGLFPSQSLEPSLGTTSRRHRVSLGRLDRFAGIAAIEVRTRHSLASGLAHSARPCLRYIAALKTIDVDDDVPSPW